MRYDDWLTKELESDDQDCDVCRYREDCDKEDCIGFDEQDYLEKEDFYEED